MFSLQANVITGYVLCLDPGPELNTHVKFLNFKLYVVFLLWPTPGPGGAYKNSEVVVDGRSRVCRIPIPRQG